jgi:threonine-phosphate decarboxylase
MDFEGIGKRMRHAPCAHGGRKEYDDSALLDFSANVNPLAPCRELLDLVREAVGDPSITTAYPDSSYAAARRSIAAVETLPSPEAVLPTNGAIELIALFFSTFTRQGEVGIITTPTFCEYERFLRQAGGTPSYCPHSKIMEEGLLQAVAPLLTDNTRSMALCNPNNPTGDLVSSRQVCALARELDAIDAMLLVDEAFIDLRRDESVMRRLGGHDNIVVCRSLTKILGIPGIRTGYGTGHPNAIRLMSCHQMPWSVNSIARTVLESLGTFVPFMDTSAAMLREELAWLSRELAEIPGITVHPSSAWYIMVTHERLTSQRMVSLLKDRGILARGCHSFIGGDPYSIRLAVKSREDNRRMLAALRAVCTWN